MTLGMIPLGSGHIVNIASLASLVPSPGLALYSASKYAVRAFSLAAAEELREHGVAVTTVCPDAVRTAMLDKQLDYPEAALTFTAPRFAVSCDTGTNTTRAAQNSQECSSIQSANLTRRSVASS